VVDPKGMFALTCGQNRQASKRIFSIVVISGVVVLSFT
jgi:hypothetical protein